MAKKKKQQSSAIAVIYARYSSHAQKDVSIEQQVAECKEYAEKNNMTVMHVYADRAITGKTDRRPEFQKMLRHAEKGQFQVVISYKSNRIARNMLHALAHEEKLSDFGIRMVYVKEEFGDNAAGRFALRTMMNVNQFYSENMSEDIKRGMIDNALKGKVTYGQLALGFKKGEDGYIEIHEDNANIIRELFARVASGETQADIRRDFNRRGLKTGRGNKWAKGSFQNLLTNESYTGVYIYGDIREEGGLPQIISKELFETVQRVLKTKKKPRGRQRENGTYMLTGKLYCGLCKSHMVGISGTGRSGSLYYYYSCQGKRDKEINCDKKNVQRSWMEEEVASAIKQYVLTDEIISWIADSVHEYGKKSRASSQLGILEGQLTDVRKAIKNIMSAIEAGIFTDTTKSRLLELEKEENEISTKILIEKTKVPEVTKEQVITWLESFKKGNEKDERYQEKLIDTFIHSVYLYEDKIKLAFSYSGKNNSIDVSLNHDIIDNIEQNEPQESGSYKSDLVGQIVPYTNNSPSPSIHLHENIFILVFPISA